MNRGIHGLTRDINGYLPIVEWCAGMSAIFDLSWELHDNGRYMEQDEREFLERELAELNLWMLETAELFIQYGLMN